METIKLANGQYINKATGEVVEEGVLQEIGKGRRIRLSDLPGTEAQLPGNAALLVLDLLGVGDVDIADLMKTTVSVLQDMRQGDVYSDRDWETVLPYQEDHLT